MSENPARRAPARRRFLAGRIPALARAARHVAVLSVLGCDGDTRALPRASPGPPPHPPRRVVATTAGALDFLVSLVGPERIVAIPHTSDAYSVAPLGPGFEPAEFGVFDAELLLSFEPDLVVSHAWQDVETRSLLQDAGVSVLALPDVRAFEDIGAALELLGEFLHCEERAAELWRDLERQKDELTATPLKGGIRLLPYSNFGAGGWTAGASTTADLLITLAGCENAATRAGIDGHQPIDLEKVLALDPDAFLVEATQGGSGASTSAESLRGAAPLKRLAAIRHDRIVVLDSRYFNTNSWAILDAARDLKQRIEALFPGR